MSGRPRTPSNVLEMRGAFVAHPERAAARKDEPVPNSDIGDPPKGMNVGARKCWVYLVEIAPHGVLGDSDRAYLEVAAELLALKRRVGVERMESAKLNRLETMLGKLGLNPADRSRVSIDRRKPRNTFDGIGRR